MTYIRKAPAPTKPQATVGIRERVDTITDRLFDELGDDPVTAIVLVTESGNHAFARFGDVAESNTTALINASLQIAQVPS